MSRSTGDSRIGGLTIGLLVLCAALVGAGYLLPSSGSATPSGYHAMPGSAKPLRLVVPSLKIRAPILPIEVGDRQVLDPPRNPRDVGWWQRSARPGATHGQTVLTGHTVHTGGGVMDHLGRLRKGQLVKVVTRKGPMVYRTTEVATWSKEQLAKRAVGLFSQKRQDGRLVLITCSGWTGTHYTSDVVVFAAPLGVPEQQGRTRAEKAGSRKPASRND